MTGDTGGDATRVTDRDANHMGGEPEIRVEHGDHHAHRVALGGKARGDEQQHQPGDAGQHRAKVVALKPFDKQSEHHADPGDKQEGRVEVGHRWAAHDHHAPDNTEGVRDQRGNDRAGGDKTKTFPVHQNRDHAE